MKVVAALLAAFQFLTRIPVPGYEYTDETLPRSLAFFPIVGLVVGGLAAVLDRLLAPHLSPLAVACLVVAFLVAVTGAFHEDALADCADAFGLPRSREKTLEIMRDSRIGSFGGAALGLSLLTRVALIASLPPGRMPLYLIAAAVLARWSTLPLSLLPAAQPGTGQGSRVAGRVSPAALAAGTVFAGAIVIPLLRRGVFAPLAATIALLLLSGAFFLKRIGGVTGDCFGATNQLVEMAVLLCGAWNAL